MKASIEMSMYPLGREYVPEIKDFIERVKAHDNIVAEVNGMSTQIFGNFREMMDVIAREMEVSFQKNGKSVFVLKIINAHLQQ